MQIQIKRAYEEPAASYGYRVLVDRLWPRGVSKKSLALDDWNKDVAPSTELRKWFGHDPKRWQRFRAAYLDELRQNHHAQALLDAVTQERLTLVYAARDPEYNHALVLKEYLVSCQD